MGTDGTILGDELRRIGYAGTVEPGFLKPYKFLELHIEQGPIMDVEGYDIGAVENLQGIHWQKVTIKGVANHAGTTPTRLRKDAGLAAAKVNVFCRQLVEKSGGVCTIGTMALKPNAVNVIPCEATFTIDLRNPDKAKLDNDDRLLGEYLEQLAKEDGGGDHRETYDLFRSGALRRRHLPEGGSRRQSPEPEMPPDGVRCRPDAQMMARICPTAMIFVPSVNGISHNPKEYTPDQACINGANVFLDVVTELANE